MSLETAIRAIVREEIAAAGVLGAPAPASPAPAEAPTGRRRGRPVKGEEAPATAGQAAAAPAAPAVAEPDPFAATVPAANPVPVATIEDVRKALTDLKAASSQEIALAVLKGAGGADNLPSLPAAKYGAVVAAAMAKQAEYTKAPAPEVDDPFAVPAAAPAAAPEEKVPTIEELRELLTKTQARTSADTVQKVWMEHGGKATKPDGSIGPSISAMPKENYLKVAAALKALPTTK